jgi:integrase
MTFTLRRTDPAKTPTHTALSGWVTKPGRYRLGPGLFFRVLPGSKAYFVFRYYFGGKEREMSLGAFPEVTLADALDRHAEERRRVKREKIDPLAAKRAAKQAATAQKAAIPTFGEMADSYIETHKTSWKNAKHVWQWEQTLGRPCAVIRDLPVDQVDTADVLKVLQPIWTTKQETAARLRGRIERVLGAAKARDFIDRDKANPAAWRDNLDHLLSKRRKLTRGHHPAVPYADVPALMAKLKRSPGTAAKALMFTILTAARTGEVLGMQFGEIDLAKAVWTVPADRMKMGKEHRVPLSDAALDILRAQEKARGKRQVYVFESPIAAGKKREAAHQPLSSMGMPMVMRRMGAGDKTVHGFRSSFRDWAGEETQFPREVCEQALAHLVGGVEGAYRRGDSLEKRRDLMNAWASYCIPTEAKVVPIAAGRRKR